MVISGGLVKASVWHKRHAPRVHQLAYKVWYLCLGLRQLEQLRHLRFLSRNRPNLFGIYDRDYGDGTVQNLAVWVQKIKDDYGLSAADGDVTLLTMPRIVNYVFNPVSFWFFLDKEGALRAVMAEVNNTFGERHCYLCRHEDLRPILPDDRLHMNKVFHVSPFMDVSGHYEFRFCLDDGRVGAWINYHDNGQLMLSTSLVGNRVVLGDAGLLRAFFLYPLQMFKVVAMIHWHALCLWLKRIRFFPKPKAPTDLVSS